jgi:REP element-mobilizing transposase RayT
MPHSYINNLVHYIFSTKERFLFIDHELELRLWPYIGGIARENRIKALAIGGTTDHVHTLLSLPATMSVAKAVQLIKGGSSNGCTIPLPDIGSSNGRRAMARSASAPHNWIRRSLTLVGRKNTTERKLLKKSFGSSWTSTEWNTIPGTCFDDFSRPFHGLTRI